MNLMGAMMVWILLLVIATSIGLLPSTFGMVATAVICLMLGYVYAESGRKP